MNLLQRAHGHGSAYILLALVGLTLLAMGLQHGAPGALEKLLRFVESKRCWVPASLATIAVFFAMLVINVAYPGYIDHAEPNIASVSWLVLKGAPLYHSLDSPERYSLLYGPTSYLAYAGALWIGGGATLSLKGLLLVANVLTLYWLYLAYRTVLDRAPAVLTVALVLVFLFVPRPNDYLFQVRADALILCCVSAGLYGVSRRPGPVALSILVLGAAFAVGAKFTCFLYFVPLLVRFAAPGRWALAAALSVCAMILGFLPFLLPNISLTQYVSWIHQGARHPISLLDFGSNLRTLAVLLLPVALVAGPAPWRDRGVASHCRESWPALGALVLCIVLVGAVSSKLGAGNHHLLPFVPILGYECALLYRANGAPWARHRPMRFRYACAIVAVIVVSRVGGGVSDTLSLWISHWQWARDVGSDVTSIMRMRGPQSIEMGYGDEENPVTFFRPLLVFGGGRLTVDEIALSDMQLSGIQIPPSTDAELTTCRTEVWLIPRDNPPFTISNIYGALDPKHFAPRRLFSDAFQNAFVTDYTKTSTTKCFDLWSCAKAAASAPGASPGAQGSTTRQKPAVRLDE